MRLLVTGGSGYLGALVIERALREGAAVAGLSRSAASDARLLAMGAEPRRGDLLDVASLGAALRGCDAVVHGASPKGGWQRPAIYQAATIGGTHNLLAAMAATGLRRLIHLSTVSVHGLDPLAGPVDDRSPLGRRFLPYDHYGRAKAAAERLVAAAHRSGAVTAMALRVGWLYGPGEERSYGRLADRLRRGALVRVGAGTNHIPLVYGPNVAGAVWRALQTQQATYRTILYAADGAPTQNDLLASLQRACGYPHTLPSLPRRLLLALAAAQEHAAYLSGYRLPVFFTRYFLHLAGSAWHLNQGGLTAELGYTPETACAAGMAATEAWYRRSRRGG